MKGILIDINKCEIREVEHKGRLDDYYHLIGCRVITSVSLNNNEDHDIILDDEGLLTEPKGLFSVDDEKEPQFAGNGVIMAVTPDGRWRSSKLPVDEVRRRITFWRVFYTTVGTILIKMPKQVN